MSSYFDEASLVMIPSGYKTSKLYSVKPTDGSGDMSFSRSNDTATRVGPDGLIEKVRTNLATYSNEFSNAAWSKVNTTVTAGQADPFGGTSAFRLLNTSAGGFVLQSGITITGSLMTASVWVKSNTGSNQTMLITANSGSEQSPAIIVTTSWQRVSWSFTSSGNSNILFAYNASTALDILAYGFQLEVGDVMTDYIPNTSAAVSVGPVANVPRLDYLNSSCPRLLLEPQRTNLVTYSEQFANWQNAGGTTTANTAISPSGYQDADTLTGARFQSSFGSNQYTASCFAKKVDGDNKLVLRLDIPALKFAQFDLATGTIDSVSADYTATITPYGNGWYRCTITTPASTSISNYVIVSASGGASNTYIWGAQLEVGAYATSYIPTLGSASTRGADACSKTGISSLIGQTEGTVFVDINFDDSSSSFQVGFAISDNAGPTNKHVWLGRNNYNFLTAFLRNTSYYIQYSPSSGGINSNGRHKMAIAYASNNAALYIDGVQIATSSSVVVPTMNQAEFGLFAASIDQSDSNINQALLFKTRLTNAQLAELTTI